MLSKRLEERELAGNPVRVGIIGAGKFGAGLIAQIAQMKGMSASVIADIDPQRARRALGVSGVPDEAIAAVESGAELERALEQGRYAVVEDASLLLSCEPIDVVVEATGLPAVGARHAFEAIQAGKHLVMVNVETDVTVGPILRRLADRAGVVYSLVDGDQPGVTWNIVEWARTLGLEIVAAGRGTILYPEDTGGTPETVPERFGFDDETLARRTINLKMYNSFRDGSKAQIEMTALANAAGLVPDVRGMHEPSAGLADIPRRFSLRSEGGLLSRHGVVELANSVSEDGRTLLPDGLRMGVFAVVRSENPFTREDLAMYGLHPGGKERNFLLYRPYHLVAVAAPHSIAKAALLGESTGSCAPTPTAETVAVAKRDLKAGEMLDGSGGYTVVGQCEKAEIARREGLLPLGLADGLELLADVKAGEALTYAGVSTPPASFLVHLRRLQDELLGP